MPTITEKIFSVKAGKDVSAGDILRVKVDKIMLHDGGYIAVKNFREIASKVFDPSRIIVIFDHICPSNKIETSNLQNFVRQFVREQNIENFYDCGEGICHQLMLEKGHVSPGDLIVGGDSHSTTYGALGSFSTGLGATDIAVALATGKTWFRVPESIKITLEGNLKRGVFAKDIALNIIKRLGGDGANYKAVEFHGAPVNAMSVSSRMTLCNMAAEVGAKAAIVPPDGVVSEYVKSLGLSTKIFRNNLDEPEEKFEFDVPTSPQISLPHRVDKVKPIGEVLDIDVEQVFIGSCTNGRLEDLHITAKILKNKKVKIRTIISPASRKIYLESISRGIVATLLKAGCILVPPGCGPCLGLHQGVLGDGDVCFSSSNRNFKGRQGSLKAKIYLGSPAAAASTALEGKIADPRRYM